MDAETIAATIARRMRELREARSLSLQAVADRAGLAKAHVWNMERGEARNPTIATMVGIASALGVSLDYLAGLTTAQPCLHPDALRIACEVDALLRKKSIEGGGGDVGRTNRLAGAPVRGRKNPGQSRLPHGGAASS